MPKHYIGQWKIDGDFYDVKQAYPAKLAIDGMMILVATRLHADHDKEETIAFPMEYWKFKAQPVTEADKVRVRFFEGKCHECGDTQPVGKHATKEAAAKAVQALLECRTCGDEFDGVKEHYLTNETDMMLIPPYAERWSKDVRR